MITFTSILTDLQAAIAHVSAQVDTSDVFLVDLTESIAAVGGSALKVSGGGSGSGGGIVTSYTSGAPGAYNISITFKGTWTASLQNVFKAAADRLSGTIIGDVKDVRINGKINDDISISAELSTIDGVGGVLGQAGPRHPGFDVTERPGRRFSGPVRLADRACSARTRAITSKLHQFDRMGIFLLIVGFLRKGTVGSL